MNTTSSGCGRLDDIQRHPQTEIRWQTKLGNIADYVRGYAAEKVADEALAIERGLREKADEFHGSGSEIYTRA